MYLAGYTLDNLSLMGLAIATGFVVDDAIVVIENITRHIENGMQPMQAALRGAEEIGFTVLSMSISLIAVFIPILMMSGIVGRLFREFAVVLSVSIFMSLLISLTTTPMMCARMMKPKHEHGRLYNTTEKFFQWVLSTYASALEVVLRRTAPVMIVMMLTIGVSVYLYIKIPKGFFPQQDTGRLQGNVQGQQHISYQSLVEKVKWFEEQVRNDPAVDTVNVTVGSNAGGRGGGNNANMNVQLKSFEERGKITSDQVIARIRQKTQGMPGAVLYLQNNQDIRIGGRQSNAQYQYTIQSQDLESAGAMGSSSSGPPFPASATGGRKLGPAEFRSCPRKSLSTGTLHPGSVSRPRPSTALFTMHSASARSRRYTNRSISITSCWRLSSNGGKIRRFSTKSTCRRPRGLSIPLSTFAHFTEGTTPLSLAHQGQFPSTTFSFNLPEGVSLSDATNAINKAELDIGMPASITGKFAGTAQQFQNSLSNQPILIGTALLAVYIILGILYESLIHPLTIISTLPSAGVGALIALVLFRTELTIVALIGIILLIGIVKKNAIMMIDFALAAERNEGLSPRDAIFQACLLRFRPIMMTTACALLGGLPLALGLGSGSELRRPLGITIVGGLLVSQMLTLFTTPVIYLSMDRLRQRFSGAQGNLS